MPLAPLNDDTAWTSFPGLSGPAYLDTASIGLLPREVGTAVAACYDALGSGLPGLARTRSAVACTRILLAEEFGCTPADITFTSSTGEAINAVARAVPWQRGDEVLVLADEFPTTLLPWSRLPDVRLVTAPPGPDDDRLGALVSAIGPRTRLVAVSHVNSCTGTVVDLAVLGAACARAGALLLCDGAQSAGVLPVDLSGVDFFVATGYKWMLAGFGIAFLITKESVRESLEPTLLGHANVPPSQGLAVGTPNLAGIHALGAAAELRRTIGRDAIARRSLALADRIREEAGQLGLRPVAHPGAHSTVVSLAATTVPAAQWVTRLGDSGVVVADRGGHLRISPHFYTRDSDIDALMHALSRLPV
ncbi:aminotransferase class V-fold PLP-dependent enzyme [Streptomyces sp. NBC_01602]|uniref:aminotransferase class V-fold PLP-dependent enzyme n=1 Tax=Streptomyces sp. NBC_01602 TaxID=2975893 RepID=UPI0038638DDC|nr:aminotransferase class V-fold PLP-dependent enzyme [Streptomyces sp. NBC_01602]